MSALVVVIGILVLLWALSSWERRSARRHYLREIDSPFQYSDRNEFDAAIRRKWSPELRKLLDVDDNGYKLPDRQKRQ